MYIGVGGPGTEDWAGHTNMSRQEAQGPLSMMSPGNSKRATQEILASGPTISRALGGPKRSVLAQSVIEN